jgi:hypothetical protein
MTTEGAVTSVADQVSANGFALIPDFLSPEQVAELCTALGDTGAAGRRGMLAEPVVAALAQSPQLIDLVRPHLPGTPQPVRAIAFDKSPDANWLVAWHQDLTIAVSERSEVPGFGPWSEKDGIPHVQPPVELLEQMLAVRLHLDPTDESNGALRVLAGTHREGRLTPAQIERSRRDLSETLCPAAAGDALLMRPLLLHASSRAAVPTRRRVLHIEYADASLPPGLDWHPHA